MRWQRKTSATEHRNVCFDLCLIAIPYSTGDCQEGEKAQIKAVVFIFNRETTCNQRDAANAKKLNPLRTSINTKLARMDTQDDVRHAPATIQKNTMPNARLE